MSATFRLATVLRLRQAAEDRARADLARALDARRTAAEAVRRAQAALDADVALADATTQTGAPAGMIADALDDVARSRTVLGRAFEASAAADAAVAMARERLATATRRREAVERLRDRAVRAARREADRREQLKLDEIGALGHVAVADGPGGAR